MKSSLAALLFLSCLLICCCTAFCQHDFQNKRYSLGRDSRFGIDYVFPFQEKYQQLNFASELAATGAGWVNFALVNWKETEPRPPARGRHDYRWNKLDAAVRHWQQAGFHIAITLRMGNGWFAGPHKFKPEGLPLVINRLMDNADRLPKPEYTEHFKQWVTAIVERYDGDGRADMPGLLSPILHYQICNEVANPAFWTGTLDDYFVLLGMASGAARIANAEVKIFPSGLRPNDFFTTNPKGDDPEPFLADYLARLSPEFRQGIMRNLELDERIVTTVGVYDILDAAGNGSWYRGTEGFYRWLERKMKGVGNTAGIWDMESRIEPILKAVETTHAHMELEIPRGQAVLNAMKGEKAPFHKKATAWYRAEQARLLCKVYVTRFAAGAQKVFVGMPMDWDKGLEQFAWPNPYMGLMSSDGGVWPATHALQMLVREIDGFASAERIETGGDVWLYKFSFAEGREPVWIVWLHEDRPGGMFAELPKKEVEIPQIPAIGSIQEIPTTNSCPPVQHVRGQNKRQKIELTPTPVLIKGK